MPAPAAKSRTPRIASQSPEPVRRKGLIDLPGGPDMAPRPPALGRAPAQPWRASGTRPPALGAPRGTRGAPRSPAGSSPCLRRARAGAPGAAERQPQRRALPAERVAPRLGEIALVGEMDLVRPVHAHGDGRRADAHLVRR